MELIDPYSALNFPKRPGSLELPTSSPQNKWGGGLRPKKLRISQEKVAQALPSGNTQTTTQFFQLGRCLPRLTCQISLPTSLPRRLPPASHPPWASPQSHGSTPPSPSCMNLLRRGKGRLGEPSCTRDRFRPSAQSRCPERVTRGVPRFFSGRRAASLALPPILPSRPAVATWRAAA